MLTIQAQLPARLATDVLHLFILGPGLGESIVVRTPEARWLVVDSHSNVNNGILPEIVLEKYGVAEIEALVLTHPDDDHYKGLAELSEIYSVRKVAATATLLDTDLAAQQFDASYLPDNTQLTVARKGGSSTYNRFSAMARDGEAEYVLLQSGSLLHEEPSGLQIVCHSPGSSTLKRLASEILTANQMSTVLEILWNGHRWVLGADLPAEEWRGISEAVAGHRAMKLPHHGSKDSLSPVWTTKVDDPVREWVTTPFNRGKNRPPQPESLAQLLLVEPWIYLTAVPSRYGHCQAGQATWDQLQANSASEGPPPGDFEPPDHCIVYLCYDRQGQLISGYRLPGTLAVGPG